jgi:HEAT repeats
MVLLTLAAVVFVAVVYHFVAGRGPKYEGHTVSYWFKEYCQSCEARTFDANRLNDAQEALKNLGTNAVPYLLEQAFNTNQDSAALTNLIRFINSLPRSWPVSAPVSQETMRGTAPTFLYRIRPPADQVLPFLERQFQLMNSSNNFAHRQAIMVMGYIGDGAARAVPLLVEALNDPDLVTQRIALESLLEIGPQATAAVPALKQKLADEPNISRRLWIASILFRIEKRPEDLKVLMDSLSADRPSIEREDAAVHIRIIGPDARAAVPALIAALPATDENLNQEIISALRQMGVPTGGYLSRLKAQLKSDDPQERLRAARVVTLAAPHDVDALAILATAGNAARAQRQGTNMVTGANGSVR